LFPIITIRAKNNTPTPPTPFVLDKTVGDNGVDEPSRIVSDLDYSAK